MRIPVLLIVNLETRPELRGGSEGDPWRLTRQGTYCSLAAWNEARQTLLQPETRGRRECRGRREAEGTTGHCTPSSAADCPQEGISSGQSTLLTPSNPHDGPEQDQFLNRLHDFSWCSSSTHSGVCGFVPMGQHRSVWFCGAE